MDYYDRPQPDRRSAVGGSGSGGSGINLGCGFVLVLAVLAIIGGAASTGSDEPVFDDSGRSADVTPDYECFESDGDAAIALRAAITSDIRLASMHRSRSINVGGLTYIATPIQDSNLSLVAAYDGDPDTTMVAVNGLARSHTDLPEGGGQEGIDEAQACL